MGSNFPHDLPDQTKAQLEQVFQWFSDNVNRVEGAYRDLGVKFDTISKELEEKNARLEASFRETERVRNQLRSVLDSFNAFHPLGRIGQVDDIVPAVLFYSSTDAGWINGTTLAVDGGVMAGRS